MRWCNSLWPIDSVLRYTTGSTMFQVMTCCLTAPSHYLSQCWRISGRVALTWGQFYRKCWRYISLKSENDQLKITSVSPESIQLKSDLCSPCFIAVLNAIACYLSDRVITRYGYNTSCPYLEIKIHYTENESWHVLEIVAEIVANKYYSIQFIVLWPD